jgi:hypothetical protein
MLTLRNLHSESTNARNVEAKYPLRLYADDTDEFAVTVGALRLTHTESTAATTFGIVPAVPPPAQASKLHAAASHHAPRHCTTRHTPHATRHTPLVPSATAGPCLAVAAVCQDRRWQVLCVSTEYQRQNLVLGFSTKSCRRWHTLDTTPHATRHTPHATRHTPHATRHTPLTDARKSSCEACQALLASWKRDVVFQNFVNAVACDVLCGLNCRDRDAKHKCDVPYRSSGKPPARRVTYPFAFKHDLHIALSLMPEEQGCGQGTRC